MHGLRSTWALKVMHAYNTWTSVVGKNAAGEARVVNALNTPANALRAKAGFVAGLPLDVKGSAVHREIVRGVVGHVATWLVESQVVATSRMRCGF